MKIQTIHKCKLPYNRNIKGLNGILNRLTEAAENHLLRKAPVNSCVGRNTGDEQIILSMTTYPARTEKVGWTIKSLLNQSAGVDRFILWLAEEQYPGRMVPEEIRQYEKYGLEICFCDDLKPHKKYYYSMKENPDAVVITVDDDSIYPEDTVEKLLAMHRRFPDAVVCNQARWITFDGDRPAEYKEWTNILPRGLSAPQMRLLPIGVGGVLYPPRCLDETVFDKEKLIDLALCTDDLWLKFMAVKKGTRAMISSDVQRRLCAVAAGSADGSELQKSNVAQGRNDRVVQALFEYFPELHARLKE